MTPEVMGIVNATPDSFFPASRTAAADEAIARGREHLAAGADVVDVGGESTRPGSQPVTAEEELRRVLPVIYALRRKLPNVPISIDTTKAAVAEQALEAGADILNDISGLRFELQIADVARRHGAPLVLMHTRGRPETMQKQPFPRDIWRSLETGFETSIRRALDAGVKRAQIILDPGLGFGKSRRQNYEILAGLTKLQRFHFPLLIGASRKSFVQAIVAGEGLDSFRTIRSGARYWPTGGHRAQVSGGAHEAQKASVELLRVGDAAVVAAAILGGAHVVRVHDPATILPAVRIADALLAAPR